MLIAPPPVRVWGGVASNRDPYSDQVSQRKLVCFRLDE